MSDPVELIVCSTCGGAERDEAGRTRGEQLLAQIAQANTDTKVCASSVRCLWACSQRCAVHLRSSSRVGYVLGRLEPTPETARALVDYAALYGASAEGAVPFKQWPEPLRGHFICRIPKSADPPAPETNEETL